MVTVSGPTLRGGALVGLMAITLMWGFNWPLMKFSLRELTPLFFRAVTMTGGSLLLFAFYSARGQDMRLPRSTWPAMLSLTVTNIFGWHLFSILGVQALASGRAAILGFTMPVWTVLLSIVFFRERLTPRIAWAALCVVAAIVLLLGDELLTLAGNPLGVLWMQLAAVSWALGTILMRRSRLTLPTSVITSWMMLLSSAAFWVIAFVSEPLPTWNFSAPMWAALFWGFAINYGISQIIWFGLARELPATAVRLPCGGAAGGILSATWIVGEIPAAGLDRRNLRCQGDRHHAARRKPTSLSHGGRRPSSPPATVCRRANGMPWKIPGEQACFRRVAMGHPSSWGARHGSRSVDLCRAGAASSSRNSACGIRSRGGTWLDATLGR
jgi:drug/metabolite transporter (DMT)-like permease